MSSNPAYEELVAKMKNLELKPATSEKGAARQLPTALEALDELKQTGLQKGVSGYRLRRKDGVYLDSEGKCR